VIALVIAWLAVGAAPGLASGSPWTPPAVTVASHGVRAVGKPKFCRTGQPCTKEAPGPVRPAIPVTRGGRVSVNLHTGALAVRLPPQSRDFATIRPALGSRSRWILTFRRVPNPPLSIWLEIDYPRGGGIFRFIAERRDPHLPIRLAG
jgi:hypothetical protein